MAISNLQSKIGKRVQQFEAEQGVEAISIKIRPTSGCFHRERSKFAYQIIDDWLLKNDHPNFQFEEHESGPEIIASINAITAVINFVTAIIKARFEGIRKGDDKIYPVELIVRKIDRPNEYIEEVILKADHLSSDIAESVRAAFKQAKLISSISQTARSKKGKKHR